MAKEKEILEYKLDITDVEAKAQRIKTLTEEISVKRGRGEDTSALEANLNKEIGAVGRLGREEKKTASATEDMVRQKDKLSNVVQVLGGRFGGLIGQLGGVAELLLQGGRAALGLGTGLIALTGAIAVVQRLRNALKEAREEQEKLNQAVTEGKLGQMGVQQGMDVELERYGLRTAAGSQAAYMIMARLMKQFGFAQERAAGIAPMAVAAGLGTEQAGVLSMLRLSRGVAIETPEQARDILAKIQTESPDVYAEMQRQLGEIAKTDQGMTAQRLGEGLVSRRPVLTAEEREYNARKQLGTMPEGVENIDEFRRKLKWLASKLRPLREQLAEAIEADRPVTASNLANLVHGYEEKYRDWNDILQATEREHRREAAWLPPPGEGSLTTQPAGVQADAAMEGRITNITNNMNEYIGTQNNASRRKTMVTRNHGVHSPGETARWRLPR